MAYTVTFGHNGKSAQYKEYEIDTPDDLDTLPVQAEITAIGSLAHSRSNNTTYKLGNNREWYTLTEGGGSGLPASTAEDAGKVLTVGSTGAAEWAAASGGGGSDIVIINGTVVSQSEGTISGTCDISVSDFNTACESKKMIVLAIELNDDMVIYKLMDNIVGMSGSYIAGALETKIEAHGSNWELAQNQYNISVSGTIVAFAMVTTNALVPASKL